MLDPMIALGIAGLLLIMGIASSILPLIPGGAISFSGIYLYWWSTDYTAPDDQVVIAFAIVGAVAIFLDYFGESIASKMGGAGKITVWLSIAIGFAGLFFVGPIGMLGFPITVFVLKFLRSFSLLKSLRTTFFTLFGLLGSKTMQLILTGAMFVGFISLFVDVSPI